MHKKLSNENAVLPLLLETDQLALAMQDNAISKKLLLCCVTQGEVYIAGHIPGSLLVLPRELMGGVKPAVGKLPSIDQLKALLARLNLTQDTHVVAYDDEGGGWAGRLIWTLDVIGHQHYSYLNGGLVAWKQEGGEIESGMPAETPASNSIELSVSRLPIASLEDVQASINDDNTVVWDARSVEEYNGTKITAQRNGHIPGAINLDWLDLMDAENHLRLLPEPVLRDKLEVSGLGSADTIITHCQTHHRSGLTYLVGKLLGLSIRAYDGSWSEWGNHPDTPIVSAVEA